MLSHAIILTIVEKGYSLYEANELELIINEIWENLKGVYADVAGGHFAAAQSAFAAAEKSRAPEQEVRNGISQLMAAYHIYIPLLRKTRTVQFMVFFSEEVPVLEEEEKTQVRGCLFEIATLIALTYSDLKEPDNASQWKDKAMKYLDDYVDSKTAYLTGEYIYDHINKEYVKVEQHKSFGAGGISSGSVVWRESTEYSLNSKGEHYVQQQKNEVRRVATKIFEAKGIH
jgi:hypothetical protein